MVSMDIEPQQRVGGLQTHCKRGHAMTPDNIYMPPKTPPGYSPNSYRQCRACRDVRRKEYEANNPGRIYGMRDPVDTSLWTRYRIRRVDYEAMREKQNHVCLICGRSPSGKGPAGQSLHVDHDKSCCPGRRSCGNCVRGLLCESCNLAIGKFSDDPRLLVRASQYVLGELS